MSETAAGKTLPCHASDEWPQLGADWLCHLRPSSRRQLLDLRLCPRKATIHAIAALFSQTNLCPARSLAPKCCVMDTHQHCSGVPAHYEIKRPLDAIQDASAGLNCIAPH